MPKLSKKDLLKNWALIYSNEAAYNYERLQALGQTNAMVPIMRKLYPNDTKKQAQELKKYMIFYNTEPSFIGTVIPGIATAMEEQRANGAEEITDETINSLRTGLMGPIAGIGDTLSQGIIYPILAGIGCSLAIAGNYLGPLFFEVVYKTLLIVIGWNMYKLGYSRGKSFILKIMREGTINKLTDVFGMIGLMVVGCMTASRVAIRVPLKLNIGNVHMNIQSQVLDALMPGLVPLALTLFVYWLIRKKINVNWIIVFIFIIGIAFSYLNIFGIIK